MVYVPTLQMCRILISYLCVCGAGINVVAGDCFADPHGRRRGRCAAVRLLCRDQESIVLLRRDGGQDEHNCVLQRSIQFRNSNSAYDEKVYRAECT